jgi:hypothetical protein
LNLFCQELGLAQHLRSLASHQGAVLALHSVGSSSRTKHVVGIIVVEPIRHAELVKSPDLPVTAVKNKTAPPSNMSAADDSGRDATIPVEPSQATLLGVAVMWVHTEHRRKGLAQHLISVTCAQPSGMFFHFIGCTKRQVAFLAPTDDGTRFASRLRGDGHVLQYSRYEDAALSTRSQDEPKD